MKIYASTTQEMSTAEKQHMELTRKLAGECVVLLENDGALPIQEKGKLALYGTGARMTVKGGSGSGEVNSRLAVNVEQGLKEAGFCITTENWLERYDKKLQTAQAEYRAFIQKKAAEQNCPEFIAEFSFPFKGAAPEEITDKDIWDSETDTGRGDKYGKCVCWKRSSTGVLFCTGWNTGKTVSGVGSV